jgi:hypothetical protein
MSDNDNLPPGCSVSDLPGNSELDAYIEKYTDDNFYDVAMFCEWLEDKTSNNFEKSLFGDAMCNITNAVMRYLLEFKDIDDDWQSLLADRAQALYWESRMPAEREE